MVKLGIDASTRTVGYAFTRKNKILDMGFVDISKYSSFKEKVFVVVEVLESHDYIKAVKQIIVEDNLSAFGRGKTSQQVIIKLAKFNAVFCFILEQALEKELITVNPLTARKQVFGKAILKGVKSKDYVKMKIEEQFDTTPWIKYNKLNNFDKRNIDMYDALVCSLYK